MMYCYLLNYPVVYLNQLQLFLLNAGILLVKEYFCSVAFLLSLLSITQPLLYPLKDKYMFYFVDHVSAQMDLNEPGELTESWVTLYSDGFLTVMPSFFTFLSWLQFLTVAFDPLILHPVFFPYCLCTQIFSAWRSDLLHVVETGPHVFYHQLTSNTRKITQLRVQTIHSVSFVLDWS